MNKSIAWIKQNKLTAILLAIVFYFVITRFLGTFFGTSFSRMEIPSASNQSYGRGVMMEEMAMGAPTMDMVVSSKSFMPPMPEPEYPPTDSSSRMVIRDTNLSMVVNDVADSISKVEAVATKYGGFLVNSNLSVPEGASFGTITIRVKSTDRSTALDAIKALGVRTVSENVSGRDVTDQYEDLDERLKVLRKTKAKFEEIMDKAVKVQDILQVQRELISVQSQMDSLKGRKDYLEKSAQLTKITIHLSTDELALPYTPDSVWRPNVVAKQAVRSLILTARSYANRLIWIAVFSIIWVPILIIGLLAFYFYNKRKKTPPIA